MPLRPLPNLGENPREWMRSVQDTIRFVPLFGRGSPVGTLDAPVGTLYINTTGGAGTVLYVKEAAGAEGWVAK